MVNPSQRITDCRRSLLFAGLTLMVLALSLLAFGIINQHETATATSHPIVSEGVAVHGSDMWALAGHKGQLPGADYVKVGIIDTGFIGISDFIGTELAIYRGVGSGAKHGN